MFRRISTMMKGGGELLAAEGSAFLDRSRHLGVAALLGAAATSAIVLAIAGLLVAAGAELAQRVGWIAALAIISGAILAVGFATFMVARLHVRRAMAKRPISPDISLKRQKAHAMLKGHEPTTMPPQTNATGPGGPHAQAHHQHAGGDNGKGTGDWKESVAKTISDHPGVAIGAAVCVVALIGPGKSLKLLSRGLMLAGIASNLKEQFGDEAAGEAANGVASAADAGHATAESAAEAMPVG